MDRREANLPANNIPINPDSNLYRSFNSTTSSSSSSSFSSSPPDFLRNVQAAFKRHRMMPQLNNIQPRRLVVPRRETSKSSGPTVDSKMPADSHDVSVSHRVQDTIVQTRNIRALNAVSHEDASITPPSTSGTATQEEKFRTDAQRGQHSFDTGCKSSGMITSRKVERDHVPLGDVLKKVHFAVRDNTRSQGSDDHMDTGTDNLLTHMGSLALTEMEWDVSNQVDLSTAPNQDVEHQNFQNLDVELSLRSNDEMHLPANRTTVVKNQINPFRNFLQSDFGHHMTQSSVVGSSCATTTLVNPAYAPMLNSATHCSRASRPCNSHGAEDFDVNYQSDVRVDMDNPSDQKIIASQVPPVAAGTHLERRDELWKDQQGKEAENCGMPADKSSKGESFAGDVTDMQSQAPLSNDQFSNVKSVPVKSDKKEKAAANKNASAPRKRNHDPDLFFKVNGKLYQRLGKIGSGGSSEVHKVISQDCTIHALKKIKLKGRDYATAYGFCQEIEYLNKLRGKDHIIQLVDYEVTDTALLKEVMGGSMSNKDGRVKEDGYIFMVLEYGEIDLAHMLSQKWKELDTSGSTIDENWLRFYWQQMLLAVKTIHEERIVHSDLKPANFLLVRGSLKLIDFGIAKAIMSDTTNIQRDSQVGTLSYMSPEAFMCNEADANGNTIKCGRPSDIWSLGCILYQMVYGRTPFAEYKTFWAKFKVITDPSHEIPYESLPNPWLLDLMKKCLAWDRNERWRIPQLLQHPFLVPPIPPQVSTHVEQHCKLLKLVNDSCNGDPKALVLCSQLQQLLRDPVTNVTSAEPLSLHQRCTLLYEMSSLCLQLREQLMNSE